MFFCFSIIFICSFGFLFWLISKLGEARTYGQVAILILAICVTVWVPFYALKKMGL